jgi:murein endopeptidase
MKWFLIAAIVGATSNVDKAVAGVPDTPLSLGYPNSGKLVGGRRFRETQFMTMIPAHANSRVRWALPALLSVLDRASRIVARKYPGSILDLGELSRRDGGPISSHLSHQNGRDADVGFYQADLDGQSVRSPRFVRFDRHGESRDDPTVRFDEKRNWAFVRAVLEDPHFEVRQIFIFAPLRARLLAYAAKVHAPRELRMKAARAMMQPVNALPHDDHFHIRISCPADQIDLGCTDLPLWHAPGSPDDFAPDLLADGARPRSMEPEGSVMSPYVWGRLAKLWSAERGVCEKAALACSALDDGPVCEDLGSLAPSAPALPPDDTGPLEPPKMDIDGTLPLADRHELNPGPTLATVGAVLMASAVVEANADSLSPRDEPACLTPSSAGDAAAPPIAPIALDKPAPAVEAPAAEPMTLLAGTVVLQAPPEARRRRARYAFCAVDDEPNTCERPMTALMSEPPPPPARGTDRNVLE